MAPDRRSRRGRRRWNRGHNGGRVETGEDTMAGDAVRRVLDSYCPFCATDIRSAGPRQLVRCPNVGICGKILPIDSNCCPSCSHYTRPGDNFCRVCRGNLRGVVRGRGGLYQQLRRAPSPFYNASPPRQEINPEQEYQDTEDEYDIDDDDVFMFPPDPDGDEHHDQQQQNNVEHDSDVDEDGDQGPREPVAAAGPAPDLLSREDLVQLGILHDGE